MDDLQDLSAAIGESAKQLGYTSLKEKQKEAAMAVLSGRDTFVALPTGYGKSVVYALLPKAFDIYRGTVSDGAESHDVYSSLFVLYRQNREYGGVYKSFNKFDDRSAGKILPKRTSGGVCGRSTN